MYIHVVHIYWSFNHILAETLILNPFPLYFLSAQATNGFYTTHSFLPFLQNLYVHFDIFHSLPITAPFSICSPLPLSQSVLLPRQTTFPQCFCLCSLSMSHVFQCSIKFGPVKKVKLTQKSEKKLEQITVQKCSSTMSVPALYTIFVPLFPPSYSSNDCCYLSFHYTFLPQAAKLEAEHYFPLFPHSTDL